MVSKDGLTCRKNLSWKQEKKIEAREQSKVAKIQSNPKAK